MERPTILPASSTSPESKSIPIELLRDIFQSIEDYRTLSLLTLVCKAFSSEASRVLYRAPKDLTPTRHIKFLRALIQVPSLASLVRAYALPPMVGCHKITCWDLLRVVLPAMTNLQELSLIAPTQELHMLPLHAVTCQLEHLSWVAIDSGESELFERWLETQKQLKHLRWIHRDRITVSPSALPNLVSLEGNSHVVEALLPSRNIKRLHWIADTAFDVSDSTWQFSAALHDLQALTFENRFNTVELCTLAYRLTSLTCLELVGYCHKEAIQNLPIPPNVDTLIFSFGPARSNEPMIPPDTRSEIVSRLFDRASKLVRVDIAEKKQRKNIVLYERWEKRSRRQSLLNSDEVHEPCRLIPRTT